jgi:hypothetical protein
MATVPLNLTGGTYRHKSRALSSQYTQNFWPQVQQDDRGKSKYILDSFYGLKLFGAANGARDRGMLEHKDVLYKVTDTTLYSVDDAGTHTNLGTIPGVSHCIMQGINDNVVIVSEGRAFQLAAGVVTEIVDPDLESPNSCAHLNNQLLFDGNGGRFAVSDVGDATSINGLNYATAESDADDLLRVYAHNQVAYMMGEKTIEPWWDSGVGNPPFDRMDGAAFAVGLGAIYSAANSDDYVYFVSNNNQIYRMTSNDAKPISNLAMAAEIAKYSVISDAHGVCFNLDGQWFYRVTFPTAMKTWILPEGGEWFNLSSGNNGGASIHSSYAFAYRKHLVGDTDSGNIYELDPDTYTENGATIIRIRDSAPLHGGMFGAPGKSVTMNRLELIMEVGVGLIDGQGSDPVIMLSFSDDGGKTFCTEMWGQIGKMNETMWKVEWFALGSFESRIIRLRISDPVYCCIHAAAADIEIGI